MVATAKYLKLLNEPPKVSRRRVAFSYAQHTSATWRVWDTEWPPEKFLVYDAERLTHMRTICSEFNIPFTLVADEPVLIA